MSKKQNDELVSESTAELYTDVPRPPEADPEEIRDLRHQLTQARKQLARYRSRFGVLREALLEVLETPPPLKVPPLPKLGGKRKREERTAVIHVSDTQGGKETATYNMEMMRHRLLLAARKVITITDDLRHAYKIDEIRVYLGGDLVEGERIFRHQAHLIDRHLLDQAVRVGPSIFVEFILALLAHFRRVKVISVPGNHGRDDHTSHPETNWDTVCGDVIRAILLGSDAHPRRELAGRLEMHVEPGWYYVDRMPGGWGNLLIHGDQISGGFAGHPWYGSSRRVHGWYQAIPEPFDYVFYGHFHTRAMATVNFTEWRANGTTESDNEFARSQMAAAGYPCQSLYYFNEEYGLVQEHNLYLVGSDDRRPTTFRFTPEMLAKIERRRG